MNISTLLSNRFNILILTILLLTTPALSCPRIGLENFVDFNCDQQHRVVITGDSIVSGIGDTRFNNKGGYVTRLGFEFLDSQIVNLGVSGITTGRLLRAFKKNLTKAEEGITQRKMKDLDAVIIDVGRNDYWNRDPVSFSVRNIRRLVKFLKKQLEKTNGVAPKIYVTTLIPTTRSFQQPFISELNRQLIRFKSNSLPVQLRLDVISQRYISEDALHPTSKGYDKVAARVSKFLRNKVRKQSAKQRTDQDLDGIYDMFELTSFGTNPNLVDTDGDGVNDGEEVFIRLTNPLDNTSF